MRYLFIISCVLVGSVNAQIVNIESLRMNNDSMGFSGQENLNFKITQTTSRLIELNNNLALQYRQARHIFLFLSNFSYTLSEETDFENEGFFHLRYNFKQDRFLTYEIFGQYQSDILLKIERRILAGVGPRVNIIRKEKVKLIAAVLAMYEVDHELGNDVEHYNTRLSSYISAGFTFSRVDAAVLVYYQPRLDKIEDYRLSGQCQLNFRLWGSLSFTSIASLSYDAFPVVDPEIPKLTYKLTNGFTYRF